jgi:hypothetical protein
VSFPVGQGAPQGRIRDFHHACAEAVELNGLWLEFGVWQGSSTANLVKHHQPVYGFDTFTGLPEPWHIHPAGYFDAGGIPPLIPGAQFIVGLFQGTLPGWLAEHPGEVALLHIDSDLYSAAEFVLRTLREARRLVPGTLVMFDEYDVTDDEQRACAEQLAPYFHGEPLYTCGARDSFILRAHG